MDEIISESDKIFLKSVAIGVMTAKIADQYKARIQKAEDENSQFEVYFTGKPLKRMQYWYSDSRNFENVGSATRNVSRIDKQLLKLNAGHGNDFVGPAFVFIAP